MTEIDFQAGASEWAIINASAEFLNLTFEDGVPLMQKALAVADALGLRRAQEQGIEHTPALFKAADTAGKRLDELFNTP